MESQHRIYYQEYTPEEERRRKRLLWISIGVHVLIFLIALLPLFSHVYPPPEQEGILISWGDPSVGQGDDAPSAQDEEPVEDPAEPSAATPATAEAATQLEPSPAAPKQQARVVTTDRPDAPQIEPTPDPAIAQQKAIAAAKARAEAEARAAESTRQAQEAEAERKRQELNSSRKQYGALLQGSGRGRESTSGTQGAPDGDLRARALEGVAQGSGKVGGGLSDRGVVYEPDIKDRSQVTGRIVVRICVDPAGHVTKAEYTQRGSTSSDTELQRIAIENARRWKFSPSDIHLQCGTVTIDFKLQ